MTDLIRKYALGAFVVLLGVALIGWLRGLDPSKLMVPAGLVSAALLTGEASNIGKRATWNPEHPDVPRANTDGVKPSTGAV